MTEKELAILNCNDYLRENIKLFLEAFVKFYGEEERKLLEERFENAILIGYQDVTQTEIFIKNIEKKYTQIYLDEEMKKFGIEGQKELFFSNDSFEHSNSMPIISFQKYYELHLLGKEKREKNFIESGLKNFRIVKPDATLEEYEKYLQSKIIPREFFVGKPRYIYDNARYYINMNNSENELIQSKENFFNNIGVNLSEEEKKDFFHTKKFTEYRKAYECYQRAIEKYNQLQTELKPFKEYVQKAELLKQSLRKKYYKDYVLSCKFLFTDQENEEINHYLNSKDYVSTPKCLNILGSPISIHMPSIITSFSKEAKDKLNDPNASEWEKSTIERDRVKYFKAKGLNLGENYQLYSSSTEAKKIWPSFETVKNVESLREKFNNDFNNEYYTNISRHKDIRTEIQNKGLLDPNDSFDASLYTLHGTFVNPNVIMENGHLKLFPLIAIHVLDNNEFLDHAIVHELNHLYELSIHHQSGSQIEYLCGWDYLKSDLSDEPKDVDTLHKNETRRNYELFNEIINELIAQDISNIMIENNMFIFNEKDNARYKGYSSYEQTLFLVREFYNEFFNEIIESRKKGNIGVIFDKVGKENFDRLNELFITFNENFSGFKYYKLMNSLNKKEETTDTKLFYDLILKKDAILDKMRNYRKTGITK